MPTVAVFMVATRRRFRSLCLRSEVDDLVSERGHVRQCPVGSSRKSTSNPYTGFLPRKEGMFQMREQKINSNCLPAWNKRRQHCLKSLPPKHALGKNTTNPSIDAWVHKPDELKGLK